MPQRRFNEATLINTSIKTHYNLTHFRQSYKVQNESWLRPATFIWKITLYGEYLSKKAHRKKISEPVVSYPHCLGSAASDFHHGYIRNIWGIFIIHIKSRMPRCKTKLFMTSPTNQNVKMQILEVCPLVYSVQWFRGHSVKQGQAVQAIFSDSHRLTLWHTQLPVRRSEPSMSLLLVLAFCQ
jgi:hypothetical protein